MKKLFSIRNLALIAILICNVSCDQVSKSIVRRAISEHETISINTYLTLLKVENTGAFLSWGNSLPEMGRVVLLLILPLMSLVFGCFHMLTTKSWSTSGLVGLACVIGGGFGNLYDRMLLGSVTDFMHIKIGIFQTGIFNLADVSIMVGMTLIMTEILFRHKPKLDTSL